MTAMDERDAMEGRRLFEDLLLSVPFGVYRVVSPDRQTFRFTYVSDRYCETLGLTREALMADSRAAVDVIHPDDRAMFQHINGEALANRAPFSWEGRILVGGETRWLHTQSTPVASEAGEVAWTGFVMDVTERKRAEAALRSSEFFLARSQEVTRLGSYEFHIGEDRWTSTRVLDEIFGIGPDFPRTADGWLELILPEDRPGMQQHLFVHVLKGRNRFDHEYRIVRPGDGAVRWMHGQGELECDASDTPLRMIGTIQDITDRKRVEQERLDLERRLLHTQKLESLGVLAGGIAHDFNNLLMAILGNLDLALSELSPMAPARTSIEQSLTAARRAADLTRQMLAYSGKASFDVRAMDLNELVEENVHLFRACVSKLVTFSFLKGRDLPAIVADAGQVQQVIMNLITNASEAIGEQPGVITLATGSRPCTAGELRRSRLDDVPSPGQFVYLEVSDTGCGMDADTQQRLFDPFFTTKFMGRGLGMSAILGIVRGHRGAIIVDSTPGTGTTVRVLFPAVARPAAPVRAAGAASGPARPAAGPGGTILVVDDEDMVRSVCRRMLEQHGWTVVEAPDGPTAITLYRERAAEIVCVVLDLSMPQMDGRSVLRELRAIRPDVKAILSSGYSQSRDGEPDPANAGFAGFIQKPYAGRALRDEVDRVIGR